MIGYFDTSAFVPILVREPTSERCRRIWDDADAVVSSRLTYVETAAALAQAKRMRRISTTVHRSTLVTLDRLWSELDIVEIDAELTSRAGVLADKLDLRGYDAVHCAAAERVEDDDLVAASGDRHLLDAWRRLPIATLDTNAS